MKPSTGSIVRMALLIIALINMGLTTLGIIPEEVLGNSQAYEVGSYAITAIIGLIAAWKNNSFTTEAIMADEYMQRLRDEGSGKDAA